MISIIAALVVLSMLAVFASKVPPKVFIDRTDGKALRIPGSPVPVLEECVDGEDCEYECIETPEGETICQKSAIR